MKKTILSVFLFLFVALTTHAQFTHVRIGVNGLTCSACSRSVEMSLRKLTFVENVEMNLENTIGDITFKKTTSVDIPAISKAVSDAGFSVRFLTAEYSFENIPGNRSVKDNGNSFYFLKEIPKQKIASLRFTGPLYQSKKEFLKTRTEYPELDLKSSADYFVIMIESN